MEKFIGLPNFSRTLLLTSAQTGCLNCGATVTPANVAALTLSCSGNNVNSITFSGYEFDQADYEVSGGVLLISTTTTEALLADSSNGQGGIVANNVWKGRKIASVTVGPAGAEICGHSCDGGISENVASVLPFARHD